MLERKAASRVLKSSKSGALYYGKSWHRKSSEMSGAKRSQCTESIGLA